MTDTWQGAAEKEVQYDSYGSSPLFLFFCLVAQGRASCSSGGGMYTVVLMRII